MSRRDLHHEFQVELMKHLKLHEHIHPDLKLIFAIPNGGKRDKVTAAKLKAEGVKPGIPDLFLPVYRSTPPDPFWPECHGLYIEIKIGKDDLSDAQEWWMDKLLEQGFEYYVARDMQETINYILAYLRGET